VFYKEKYEEEKKEENSLIRDASTRSTCQRTYRDISISPLYSGYKWYTADTDGSDL